MITVAIFINGNPIITRSAVNQDKIIRGHHTYMMDDGNVISHKRDNGAVKLAIKMLEKVKEI